MQVTAWPSEMLGEVAAPPSKSVMQRAVAAALLAREESTLYNISDSDDCQAALAVAQALGAVVHRTGSVVTIRGGFPHSFLAGIREARAEIQCGESGLASRLFLPIAALHNQAITIQGKGSLLKRPFADYERVLPSLGVEVRSEGGFLPVTVCGPMVGGELTVDGRTSSQFLSGLLMALPRCKNDSIIHATELRSKPYVDLTMEIMAYFGVESQHLDHTSFSVKGSQLYEDRELTIPGDWSGAAFLLVAGALCSSQGIRVTSLSRQFTQADAAILHALAKAGVDFTAENDTVVVKKSTIRGFEFDATDCPDLIPPLAALAAFADGVVVLRGAQRLLHKESQRGRTLKEEFGKAGIHIALRDDEMIIHPGHVRPAVLNSHNDHRIAMACAVLGLSGAKTVIQGAECTDKSYPAFWDHLRVLGARV